MKGGDWMFTLFALFLALGMFRALGFMGPAMIVAGIHAASRP